MTDHCPTCGVNNDRTDLVKTPEGVAVCPECGEPRERFA